MAGEIPLLSLKDIPRVKSTSEQPAATLTLDIDGATGKGPLLLFNEGLPMQTILLILKGQFNEKAALTALQKGPNEAKREKLEHPSAIELLHHKSRGLNKETVQAIQDIEQMMGLYEITLTQLLVSGRGTGLYDATQKQFTESGLNLHGMCLNPDRGTTAWKGAVDGEIIPFQDVAHFDDDLITSYALSLLGVLSFVPNKPYYSPALLARSGFVKPPNLIFVNSPSDIPKHMEQRIESGKFGRIMP